MSVYANKLVIAGGHFNQNNFPHSASVIQRLYESRVAKDAFYNSEERSEEADIRNVNVITRKWIDRRSTPWSSILEQLIVEDVIKDIIIWLHEEDATHADHKIMWVYDDDRSLTSLVGQAVADILSKRAELTAAYFFPKVASRRSVTDTSRVVPTIAYQLTRNIPATEMYISDTITHDLAVFDLNVHEQVEKLLVDPLKRASQSSGDQTNKLRSPNLIIIHGLEDCSNANFQTLFLDALVHAWSASTIPFLQRLLLIGRPTTHLQESLGRLEVGLLLQRPVHKDKFHWREREEISCQVQDSRRREAKLVKELQEELREEKRRNLRCEEQWKMRMAKMERHYKTVQATLEKELKLKQVLCGSQAGGELPRWNWRIKKILGRTAFGLVLWLVQSFA